MILSYKAVIKKVGFFHFRNFLTFSTVSFIPYFLVLAYKYTEDVCYMTDNLDRALTGVVIDPGHGSCCYSTQ